MAPEPGGSVTTVSTPVSRAVLRPVEPGNDAVCAHCRAPIKFTARQHRRQAIANVYVDGTWSRVEHYHEPCYEEAGEPHGPAVAPDGRSAAGGDRGPTAPDAGEP